MKRNMKKNRIIAAGVCMALSVVASATASAAEVVHPTCAIDPVQIASNVGDVTVPDNVLHEILKSKGYQVEPRHSDYETGFKLSLKIHASEQERGILRKKVYSVTGDAVLVNLDTKEKSGFTASALLRDREAAVESVVSQIESSLPECRQAPLSRCKGIAGVTMDGYTWTNGISSGALEDASAFEGSIQLKKEFDVAADPEKTNIEIRFGVKDFIGGAPVINARKSGASTDFNLLVRILKAHLETESRHSIYFSIEKKTHQHSSYDMNYAALGMAATGRNPIPAYRGESLAEALCVSPDNTGLCFGLMHVYSFFEVRCQQLISRTTSAGEREGAR